MDKVEIDAAVKAAKKEYYKAWRAANREKVKEYNLRYWEKRVKEQQEDFFARGSAGSKRRPRRALDERGRAPKRKNTLPLTRGQRSVRWW